MLLPQRRSRDPHELASWVNQIDGYTVATSTKRFFHLLTYTLRSSSCVALLDVVEKSSIAAECDHHVPQCECGDRWCTSDEHCLESGMVLRIGDHVRFQAVPHLQKRDFPILTSRTSETVWC